MTSGDTVSIIIIIIIIIIFFFFFFFFFLIRFPVHTGYKHARPCRTQLPASHRGGASWCS